MFNGIITVRTLSSRLPGKCFLSFGRYSVLEYIILRAKHFNINPIICTTIHNSDDKIIDLAKKHKTNYFRGAIKNKIKRWRDCANFFNLKEFHTIDADDPFFCGDEMKFSINNLKKNKDLDIIFPSKLSSSGAAFVGYSFTNEAINKLSKEIRSNTDTEMIEPFIKKNRNLKFNVFKDPTKYKYTARMTLDYIEDYLFLDCLRSKLKLYPKRRDIYKLLRSEPSLININYKKNSIWKKNQLNKINKIK